MPAYKVLIPLDGSRLAETALAYVPFFRRLGDLHLRLVGVTAATEGEAWSHPDCNLETHLTETATRLQRDLGIAVDTHAESGDPADGILETAHRLAPDLLVVATHGRSGLARLQAGGISDEVIRRAECPVFVIGPKVDARREGDPFRRILVPLDGSPTAEAALPVAIKFGEAFGAELHFVRVVLETVLYDATLTNQPQLVEAALSGANTYVESVETAGAPQAIRRVVVGRLPTALSTYAAQHDIDLVVMASAGRSGIERTLRGSVADRMLQGPAPVIVVHPGPQDGHQA